MINIQKKWDTIYADVNLQKIALDYKNRPEYTISTNKLTKEFQRIVKVSK